MTGDSLEMEGPYMDPDDIARTLSSLTPLTLGSRTMQLDQSQPPTPDGSGRPVNFQVIAPGIYRSSYPAYAHYQTLTDLELKTIVTLVNPPLSFEYSNFISSNGIIHHQIPVLANKEGQDHSSQETICDILRIMLDPSNYPILIHCNKGKHRTGCITACFRKVTGWTMDACIEEYERYSSPKDRQLDKVFIERFDAASLKSLALDRGYVGGVYRQPVRDSTKSSIYTNNTADTFTSEESEIIRNDYQERARKENEAALESSRLWSYK